MTTIDFFTKEELFEIAEYLEKKNKILNELNELKKDCDKHKEILIPINKEYEEIKEEIVKQLIQNKFINTNSDIRRKKINVFFWIS
jgi:galactose-1-phosphate uridylyltransferase